MLKEIAQFIENKTAFVIGTTLQVAWRPDTAPDRCLLIAETGPAPGVFELPDRVDKMIMIKSRAVDYWDARADAVIIWELFNGTAGWQLPQVDGGTKYEAMTVDAISFPQYLGIDKAERHEFSTNYQFKLEDRDA